MFEKIVTRAFFATLFSALALAGAHTFDAMQAVAETQSAAAAAKTVVATTQTPASTQN